MKQRRYPNSSSKQEVAPMLLRIGIVLLSSLLLSRCSADDSPNLRRTATMTARNDDNGINFESVGKYYPKNEEEKLLPLSSSATETRILRELLQRRLKKKKQKRKREHKFANVGTSPGAAAAKAAKAAAAAKAAKAAAAAKAAKAASSSKSGKTEAPSLAPTTSSAPSESSQPSQVPSESSAPSIP